MNGAPRQVTFSDRDCNHAIPCNVDFLEEETESNLANKRCSSSSDSSNDPIIPTLHQSLLRTHKKKDPFQYYDALDMLGGGSMGSVCRVKKRAVGGSARALFLQEQKKSPFDHVLKKILPCLAFCPIVGSGEEETKTNALVRHRDSSLSSNGDDIMIDDAVTSIANETTNPKTFSKNLSRHSDMISFHNDYGVVYALKSIVLNQVKNTVFVEELKNEIAILRTLDHPNICKAIETYEFRNRIYLVLELCSGGDLYSRDPYNECQAKHVVRSILNACAFMNRNKITHRDLKYENVMFASPTSRNVKVIDFGLSKKYFENETMNQTVGTVYTMAPEVLNGHYDQSCDAWSIGVLAFMLLSSSLPFFGKSRSAIVKKILRGDYAFRGQRWKEVSEDARDFVKSLLVRDVKGRPSCQDALSHKWFESNTDDNSCIDDEQYGAMGQTVNPAVMDRVQATIHTFAQYSKLKKLALYVIAYKSTADEIGFLQQLFQNRFDVKKDGIITLKEFKQALSVYSYTDQELETIYNAVDIDGCNDVSYTEFLAATIEAHGILEEDRIAEAFDRLDSDDNGYITGSNLKEFLGSNISEEYIDGIIEEVDVSHDHQISYEEFLGLWDGSFDEMMIENLKSVRHKRLMRERSNNPPVCEEGEDGEFLKDVDENDNEYPPPDSSLESAPPGAGKFFFEQEKEKDLRGVWI